jgi:UDP-N-acetylmuramyl tripeptide synthase
MFCAAGDREDNVIKKMTEYLYNSFDIMILFVTEETKRGRNEQELINLMTSNIRKDKKVELILNENKAIDKSFSYINSSNNDIVLLLIDNVKDSIEYIMDKIKV